MRSLLALVLAAASLRGAGLSLPYSLSVYAGGTFVGDGGLATSSPLRDAEGICIDTSGNIYIADSGDNRVRIISSTGIISTIAGSGMPGPLTLPYGLAVDGAGSVYVADLGNNRIRKILPDGSASTLLDHLSSPRNLLLDNAGNLYFSEFAAHRVRKLAPDGTVTLIAGSGLSGADGDNGSATLATLSYPAGLAMDAAGALYIADSGNHKIRRVAGGKISTVLGTGQAGNGTPAQLNTPTAVAVDNSGTLYVSDSGNQRIRSLTTAGIASTIPVSVRDLALDSSGGIVAAGGEHAYRILSSGAVTTIAGDGSILFRGDGGPAVQARLNAPSGLALDSSGNLWISDTANSRVRTVTPAGQISTAAGGDGSLIAPIGLAMDAGGNLLVADPASSSVRELAAFSSSLFTIAGTGMPGVGVDGIPALSSSLQTPNAVAIAPGGGFYIADTGGNRIRRVLSSGGVITIAGNGNPGFNDGGFQSAQFSAPSALCLDPAGNIYIADTQNNRIRLLSPAGIVSTVLGPSQLNGPRGVAMDSAGNLWIADTGNHRVLALPPGGAATPVATGLQSPVGLAVDPASGAVYVADAVSNAVLLLSPPLSVTELPASLPVVNSATLLTGPVAPGSLISVFGSGLAQAQALFDGKPVTALLAQENRLNLQVPLTATGAFEVRNGAASLLKTTLVIVPAAPGIFTGPGGVGPVTAANPDGAVNSSANPAMPGDIVTFYATGAGQTNAIQITMGGLAAKLLYGGSAPGLVGITQINAQVPAGIASGAQPLLMLVGSASSQPGVTIAIR